MTTYIIEDLFRDSLNHIAKRIHDNARRKGFWDKERNDSEMLMLMVTELAEACEGIRHGNPASEHIPDFTAAEEELADCIIRLLDMAHGRKWKLAEAVLAKMQFNAERPHMHGKKF